MALTFELKIDSFPGFEQELINELRNNTFRTVKINTNKKAIKYDNKDARFIKSIDNVKICYERKGGGIVGFIGNIQCDFRPPFGGMFFVKRSLKKKQTLKALKVSCVM